MARDDKISMPNSMAGITRYFDDYKSKITLKPQHVLVMIAAVVLLITLLHAGIFK